MYVIHAVVWTMTIHGQTFTSIFQWLSFMGFNAVPRNSNGIITLVDSFLWFLIQRVYHFTHLFKSINFVHTVDLQWTPQKSQIPTSLCVVQKKEELHAPGKNTSSTRNRPSTVLHGISYSSSNLATCACEAGGNFCQRVDRGCQIWSSNHFNQVVETGLRDFSSRFVVELELDLLAVDLDQYYSRIKAHAL